MDDSVEMMLDEIAAALRSGEDSVLEWLRDQLEQTGATEVAVGLSVGVIARLIERTPGLADGAAADGRRRVH